MLSDLPPWVPITVFLLILAAGIAAVCSAHIPVLRTWTGAEPPQTDNSTVGDWLGDDR